MSPYESSDGEAREADLEEQEPPPRCAGCRAVGQELPEDPDRAPGPWLRCPRCGEEWRSLAPRVAR